VKDTYELLEGGLTVVDIMKELSRFAPETPVVLRTWDDRDCGYGG